MRARSLLFVALTLCSLPLEAQQRPSHGAAPAAGPSSAPPREAAQFDFLVGQWSITVKPKATRLAEKIHGVPRLLGTWKAWRALDGFGVQDELRIVDGSGNPNAFSLAVRLWSAAERRWIITASDPYRGRVTSADASWNGKEMLVTGRASAAGETTTRTRSRFTDITPTSFRFVQDRSDDNGKSWDERVLTIEATRVAATAPR